MILIGTRPSAPKQATNAWARCAMSLNVHHRPVLLDEAIEALAVHAGGTYIDCTVGEGGHAQSILKHCLPGGHLLAIDADPDAIKASRSRLDPYKKSLTLVHGSYASLQDIAQVSNLGQVDGILLDIGLSSLQLEASTRGFSFRRDEFLDMRYNPAVGVTAAEILNTSTQDDLVRLIRNYGEERRARVIARAIVQHRPITTSNQLVEIMKRVMGPARGKIHPATRTFQALRIAVNSELENLEIGLGHAMNLLKPGGRLVVISYHSLEDRLVKTAFQTASRECICPKEVLECACNHLASLRVVNRRIVTPSQEELQLNRRARSARMRVAERLL